MKKIIKTSNLLKTLAKDISLVANMRHAAAIIYKGRAIAFGISKQKTHPFQAKYSKNTNSIFLHAENDAIKNAMNYLSEDELKRSTMVVVRVKKDGTFGMSKPCAGCQRALAAFNIKKVFYSTDSNTIECL